jgi:3'-phosphoadenosine 5'-phosphosulfate sulfotransferase (PAPS reductase)/FAD synthetase
MNSGYALPETYPFRDRILHEWRVAHYVELPPALDYLEGIRRYGLCCERTKADRGRVITTNKKSLMEGWARDNGHGGYFLGLRADESLGRRAAMRVGSPVAQVRGLWRICPLAWMRHDEVWAILDHYKVPYNPLYDHGGVLPRDQIRNTGWLTTEGADRGRLVWLRRYYPDLFNRLAAEFPEVRSYV